MRVKQTSIYSTGWSERTLYYTHSAESARLAKGGKSGRYRCTKCAKRMHINHAHFFQLFFCVCCVCMHIAHGAHAHVWSCVLHEKGKGVSRKIILMCVISCASFMCVLFAQMSRRYRALLWYEQRLFDSW